LQFSWSEYAVEHHANVMYDGCQYEHLAPTLSCLQTIRENYNQPCNNNGAAYVPCAWWWCLWRSDIEDPLSYRFRWRCPSVCWRISARCPNGLRWTLRNIQREHTTIFNKSTCVRPHSPLLHYKNIY
jgi:hypothetical protein